MSDTIEIAPHGLCRSWEQFDQVWAECGKCNAQWEVHGPDDTLVQVFEGNGSCGSLGTGHGRDQTAPRTG